MKVCKMIKFFKLVNGEEVVAETEWEGPVLEHHITVTLTKPFCNRMTQEGLMLSPYPCKEITVYTHNIIFVGIACEQVAEVYREATGSIVVPPKDTLQMPPGNNRFDPKHI